MNIIFQQTPRPKSPHRGGFSLVELLVVISILAILAVISIVVIGKVRAQADVASCANNLRQSGIAIQLYSVDHDGSLPGPISVTLFTTYRINHSDLGAFLTPYWDLPPADTITRLAPPLACPTLSESDLEESVQDIPHKSYQVPFRLKGFSNYNNPSGNYYYSPFGKGQPDKIPMTMQALMSIPKFSPADQWMMQDFDQGNSSLVMEGQAEKPVHDSVRNVLFFDGHVEAVPSSIIYD